MFGIETPYYGMKRMILIANDHNCPFCVCTVALRNLRLCGKLRSKVNVIGTQVLDSIPVIQVICFVSQC